MSRKMREAKKAPEKKISSPLHKHMEEFLDYLEIEKNRSLRTKDNYCFYLKRFHDWLCGKKSKPSSKDITGDLVREYRLWLNRLEDQFGRPLKKNTQNYHLIALRAFLKYLSKRDIDTLAPEKIELSKMPERSVDFLEGSDLERLLETPLKNSRGEKLPEDKCGVIHLRDKAILELLFSTGLRVSELAGLKRESINLKKDEFTVRGKGDKPRIVFLSEQARYWIKKYLDKRTDAEWALFVSHDRANKKREEASSALTPRSIQRLVEKYSHIAGLTKHVTPHTMRHSYATDLLLNGADIRSVQAMLGHSSITTTQIYTHITNRQLREIHKKFHRTTKDES